MKTNKFSKIAATLFMVFLIAALTACVLTACNETQSQNQKQKQVPVYNGMVISSSYARSSASTAADGQPHDDNNGHYKGDHEHRDDDFDEDKPFDEKTPSIEDKAQSTLDVVGALQDIYYADAGQDIFITIKLSNPDSYEILSFTLNGKKYSNYMFEEGSDMENLVLKVNVGTVGGIHDYTIDAIKYVDGTDIKDVRMDGDRTVKAGVRAYDQTYASVTNEKKSMTSISFDVQVVDLYSLIQTSGGYAKAVLYDGVNMISKDINVGEKTSVTFDNLTPNAVYQYGVVALYDDLSGNGINFNTLYKKAVYTDTIVLFKDVEVGQETLSWGYVWNDAVESKTITALELMQNGTKVKDVDAAATSIDGLKTDNEYTLKATYKNLQNQDESIQITFTTLTKAVPSVEIGNLTNTQSTLSADVTYTDVDGVGQIESIALFKGATQVATTSERTHVVFNALESDTEYTLVVTYKYDLNDGKGEQTATQSAKRYTSPQFEFVEATCANTSAVSKGEIIYFEAKVVNPSGVAIERIKINDKFYTPSSGTTKTSIIVNITVEDQFEGGNTALEVTEIQGTLRGQKVTIVPTQSNVANVFVNGELSVKSIKIVDEDGKECDMVVVGKQYYYIVSFNNKTGYSIDSIDIKNIYDYNTSTYLLANGDYTMQDAETAKIPVTFNDGQKWKWVTNVKYSNAYLGEKSKEIVGVKASTVCVTNEVPIVVTTAEQLKSMNGWGYYVLENDIDLAGTEWKDPADFKGYFDGQGYAIKNMNFVGTIENKSFYWGLFDNARGVIKNLSLNGRLIVTINRTDEYSRIAFAGGLCASFEYYLSIENVVNNVDLSVTNNCGYSYVGGLLGNASNYDTLIITDCCNTGSVNATGTFYNVYAGGIAGKVSDDVVITDCCNTGSVSATGTSYNVYAGGIAGEVGNDVVITDCCNTGSVSATGSKNVSAGGIAGEVGKEVVIMNSFNTCSVSATDAAGGIVGRIYGCQLTILNSYNTGTLSASMAGGLLGDAGYSSRLTITDCYNIGTVSARDAGGLVGHVDLTSTMITGSYNVGSVRATGRKAGGIVGYDYGILTVTDCLYTLPENSDNNYGEKKDSVAEIVAIMKDLWDGTIWDFDNLDENGNPTLKI